MKPMIAFAMILALLLGTASLSAHDVYRITGKVVKVTDSEISVQDKNKKIFKIGMENFTTIWRGKGNVAGTEAKVARSELKVGLTVEVNASGDDEDDLGAQTIIILPSPKPAK